MPDLPPPNLKTPAVEGRHTKTYGPRASLSLPFNPCWRLSNGVSSIRAAASKWGTALVAPSQALPRGQNVATLPERLPIAGDQCDQARRHQSSTSPAWIVLWPYGHYAIGLRSPRAASGRPHTARPRRPSRYSHATFEKAMAAELRFRVRPLYEPTLRVSRGEEQKPTADLECRPALAGAYAPKYVFLTLARAVICSSYAGTGLCVAPGTAVAS